MSAEYARRLICPHCGYAPGDGWERGDDEDGEDECGECGKVYLWSRHVEVTWSTYPKEPTTKEAT